MQRSKTDILETHKTIGKSHFKELQGSKINKKPVQMHPQMAELLKKEKHDCVISLDEFLK